MQLSDFDFFLPPELIARYPLEERTASRLMCLDDQTDRQFRDITNLLQPGDLLVFNDTRVIPARLLGRKASGGQVEILVERVLDEARILGQMRVSKPPRVGEYLYFPQQIALEILGRQGVFYELGYQHGNTPILEAIEAIGHIPLPPYMHRSPEERDKERYQTVFAKHKGSVAAPTAGFHFDEVLLEKITNQGVNIGYLTLHIGAGTFAPVRVTDIATHQMHAEYLEVPEDLCAAIEETKARGHRVIAVGTTCMRALETACQSGTIAPYRGETSIFIYPGYIFRCADVLITNFHLPCSTLLMLVCAFGGQAAVMKAYQHAVVERYRFYSYGDAMWVAKK